jgi:hypothetical protein
MSNHATARGPHFLGIGAPRCGTTWLHTMLRRHPRLWLPPLKEVHYFDSVDPTVAEERSVHRLSSRLKAHFGRRALHYGAAALGPLAGEYRKKAQPDLDWDRRFFSPGGSFDWYQRLFAGKAARYDLVGEITPAYFILGSEVIQRIRQETPVRKVLLLLRDPIEAAWSGHGRKVREGQLRAGHDDSATAVAEILGPGIRRRLYAENLGRWLQHFDRRQIFIGYYDDLVARPDRLLGEICSFLEVAPVPAAVISQARQRVNSSQSSRSSIPPAIEKALAQRLEPDLRQLGAMLGGVTLEWHRRALLALDRRVPE